MPRAEHPVRTRRAGILAGVAIVLALATGCYSGSTAGASREVGYPTGSSYAEVTERQLMDLMNTERAAAGLARVSWNGQLGWLSMDWSQTMSARSSFTHRDLDYAIRNLVSGFSRLGENILVGGCGMTAAEMHKAWMKSPGHRANIMASGYNVAAVGVVCGSDGRVWATTNFGLA